MMRITRRESLKDLAASTAAAALALPTALLSGEPQRRSDGGRVHNPFAGATFYRNVDRVAVIRAAAEREGGELGRQMRAVANEPTFIWLESIAAVHGGKGYARSLSGHLDEALGQDATAVGLVVYNLPNRDGAALASNGELLVAQDGMRRYKTEFIDAIADVIKRPKYRGLRIVLVVEPDSLPNLIANLKYEKVKEADESGAYVRGVQYAVGTLRSAENIYAYIDVGHAGWMGWPANFRPFVELVKRVGAGISGGVEKVDGFVSNVANYNPFEEPYLTAEMKMGGQQVRALSGFYDFNDFIDERGYATALRAALTAGPGAYPKRVGLLCDTSRNGWGGPARPTGPSVAGDFEAFVRATAIDKRIHKGNWGNQAGAGLGARPTAAPVEHYHAFAWVKPPGESDGSSAPVPPGPDNPRGYGFDRMCDPTYQGNALNGNNPTGALADAPVAGRWFQDHFVTLVRNAHPPVQSDNPRGGARN